MYIFVLFLFLIPNNIVCGLLSFLFILLRDKAFCYGWKASFECLICMILYRLYYAVFCTVGLLTVALWSIASVRRFLFKRQVYFWNSRSCYHCFYLIQFLFILTTKFIIFILVVNNCFPIGYAATLNFIVSIKWTVKFVFLRKVFINQINKSSA